ncbi:MAG: hypothetical protein JWN71_4391 [Xanthobacteraceae bacterium]|jgi:hypothetical protein|nr:hypothetical protein [Xanthobacteraceae bacterium]
MRKLILALSAFVAMAITTPVSAHTHLAKKHVAPVAGVVVGTAVGVGIYNGWFGSTIGGAALPSTALGAAAGGFIAGVGTAALIHATITPCTGFQAVFSPFFPQNANGCVDGKWVGHKGHHKRHHARARY